MNKTEILDVEAGDVFALPSNLKIVILKNYMSKYVLSGYGDSLCNLFADGPKSKQSLLKYLNSGKAVKIGVIGVIINE